MPFRDNVVLAKIDYTFGEYICGVDGKAGMRVSW
jgi:hypothetical protein